MPPYSLIDADDSLLLVIDVQKPFTVKLGTGEWRPLVDRMRWLIRVAGWCGVPLVVTAEDIPVLGGVLPQIESALPPETKVYNKMVFGVPGNPEIMAGVEATGRKTAVLVGLETDVCVAHSAIGLLERGYRVVAVSDCVGSPGTAHEGGLQRMRDAGAILVTAKSLLYEWLRDVERSKRFHAECDREFGIPEGVVL